MNNEFDLNVFINDLIQKTNNSEIEIDVESKIGKDTLSAIELSEDSIMLYLPEELGYIEEYPNLKTLPEHIALSIAIYTCLIIDKEHTTRYFTHLYENILKGKFTGVKH